MNCLGNFRLLNNMCWTCLVFLSFASVVVAMDSIVHHVGLVNIKQHNSTKSEGWSCDSTIIIQQQYGDGANSVLKTPKPANGLYDNMTCITKILSPVHTRILFAVQSLRVARMDRRRNRACKHGAVIVFLDPPHLTSRTLFCQRMPDPIISQQNKLVVIYKLFRFALKPMEFEAYFTVIYVARINNRLTFNISPLLKDHGTITEIPALYQENSSQRWNLKLKKYINCTLNIVPTCNSKDILRVGYEHPLDTGSMLFVSVTCDEPVGTPYKERTIVQKRVPNNQLMYIDLEVNSQVGDQFSVSWECSRNPYQQKEIKMIAGLPSETITTLNEPDPDAVQPIRPLVLSSRYNEVKQLEAEYL